MQGFHANGIFEGKNGGEYGESRGAMQTATRQSRRAKALIPGVFHVVFRVVFAPDKCVDRRRLRAFQQLPTDQSRKLRMRTGEGVERLVGAPATERRRAENLVPEQGVKGGTSVPPSVAYCL